MTGITGEDVQRLKEVAVNAAVQYAQGSLSHDDYMAILATIILEAKGVPDPDSDQIREQVSEMRTAMAFISAPVPNN